TVIVKKQSGEHCANESKFATSCAVCPTARAGVGIATRPCPPFTTVIVAGAANAPWFFTRTMNVPFVPKLHRLKPLFASSTFPDASTATRSARGWNTTGGGRRGGTGRSATPPTESASSALSASEGAGAEQARATTEDKRTIEETSVRMGNSGEGGV